MPSADRDTTPQEVRSFALLQVGLTGGFYVLLFFVLGGTDADWPPVWLSVALLVLVGVGAFLAERVWMSAAPLAPETAPADVEAEAVSVFAAQTVRKLILCEVPLLIAVLVAFIVDHGGWPLVVAGFPGLAVLCWEVWPSLRNTSMTAAMLDSGGADSQLVESFRDS